MASKSKIEFLRFVNEAKRVASNLIAGQELFYPNAPIWESSIYVRLSTEEQCQVNNGSLVQQINMAFDDARIQSKQNNRNYVIKEVYIEPGVSGLDNDRIEFNRLKRDIRANKYKAVFIKELVRLSRRIESWKSFFRECNEAKCQVIIQLPINPNDPAQILQLDIVASVGEYESRNTAKRIRTSVASAMRHDQKFNSTHQVFGLDPKIDVNGNREVGYYQPNEEELKIVTYIMETFLQCRSYGKTLEILSSKGIKNKNGNPFGRHSLEALLKNPKYIGKWFLNTNNKDIPEDELPIEKRYAEIDLPHGCVIDLDLYNRVQEAMALIKTKRGMDKDTGDKHIYLLSGGLLLFDEDQSTFHGVSGKGRNKQKHFYYFNEKHRISISANELEDQVAQVVASIIKNSPDLQKAIRKAGTDTKDTIQAMEQHLKNLQSHLSAIEEEHQKCFKSLNKLLSVCDTEEEMRSIKNQFQTQISEIAQKRQDTADLFNKTQFELTALRGNSFTWKDVADHAENLQQLMREHTPVQLKKAYRELFDGILVGQEDEHGIRSISYLLKGTGLQTVRERSELVHHFSSYSNHFESLRSSSPIHSINSKNSSYSSGYSGSSTTVAITIGQVIIEMQLQTRPYYKNPEYLRKKYLDEGLSARQLALQIGCPHSVVNSALVRFGIFKGHRKSGKPEYGWKFDKDGKRVPNLAQQKVIGKIRKLRAMGWSLVNIAEVLNEKGVKAPGGGVQWSAIAVGQVMRRSVD